MCCVFHFISPVVNKLQASSKKQWIALVFAYVKQHGMELTEAVLSNSLSLIDYVVEEEDE